MDWKWFEPVRQALPRMPSGEERSLTTTGNNLSKFLNSLQSNNPRLLIKLVDEVIKVMPMVKEILAPFRGSEVTVEIQENGLKTPTTAGNISLGLMQIFILVFGILTKKKGSTILIEEPELFLHARSQRRLFKLIQRESKDKQFFITSHSTIFTACNNENCTYLVTKPEGASRVFKIQNPEQLKIIKGVLGHRNTDFYGNECVVFIEGDSEEVAFPLIAESLGHDLASKGISLVNVKGSGKAKKLDGYLRYLKGSETIPYVILDGSKSVKEKLEDWEREGLIEKGHWTIWDMEFEDCFNLEMIARAINEVIKEQGGKLQIKPELLEKECEQGKSIVKTLKKIFYENDLNLDKPALAEKIAYLLDKDMQNKNHKATPPEIEIKKIVEVVESKYGKDS